MTLLLIGGVALLFFFLAERGKQGRKIISAPSTVPSTVPSRTRTSLANIGTVAGVVGAVTGGIAKVVEETKGLLEGPSAGAGAIPTFGTPSVPPLASSPDFTPEFGAPGAGAVSGDFVPSTLGEIAPPFLGGIAVANALGVGPPLTAVFSHIHGAGMGPINSKADGFLAEAPGQTLDQKVTWWVHRMEADTLAAVQRDTAPVVAGLNPEDARRVISDLEAAIDFGGPWWDGLTESVMVKKLREDYHRPDLADQLHAQILRNVSHAEEWGQRLMRDATSAHLRTREEGQERGQ